MVAAAKYPDPRTLYDEDPTIEMTQLRRYGAAVGGVASGLGAHAFANYLRGRPYRTAIYLYPIYGATCCYAFCYIQKLLRSYYAKRDQIHKHYVLLHPEDFPPPPKIKIGEIFEPWTPVR